MTGTYWFDVKVGNSACSYRCDLQRLMVKGGYYGVRNSEQFFFVVPEGVTKFRVSVNGYGSKDRYRCGAVLSGPAGTERAHVVWWKTSTQRGRDIEPHVLEVHPAKDETGKVWRLRTSNIPYITLEGVPPYLAKRPEACFVPEWHRGRTRARQP